MAQLDTKLTPLRESENSIPILILDSVLILTVHISTPSFLKFSLLYTPIHGRRKHNVPALSKRRHNYYIITRYFQRLSYTRTSVLFTLLHN
jgi:hypothetical protein